MQTAIYDQIFDAQQHYRLILDSMARPGKISVFPELELDYPAGINRASILIAMALLNTDVSFTALAEFEGAIADYIALHTSAVKAELTETDFVFVPQNFNAEFIYSLKVGNLPYPEESATIIADANAISTAPFPGAMELTLKGPGINGTTVIYIAGLNPEILDELKIQNAEFPLGIDLMVTDADANLICIPRSTSVVISH
ncbi:alpha-D-ribose 1-methylphosphonate 5-triphosphate synthase subunit PhnH [Mucilaginibacter yixingensis]|uniref:Alpha-D-ribose 1-methylphosphonate 5-triphosphate synthase subunit PhnH n=1 Tax=Mucilaginibacter yixingensis TaxID=1295612 RepID=A0A2T5J4R6_9SPHI|nr:phosphonate C-P lyase system protein PhnH [Mucilaginibacter yixingensis]PTQ92658.1 alpha-D-ribose 1-methylphosphonate 5-triphosphate synthase subunit PhnH [Mucilaginibacter yixingensis]